MKAVNAPKGSGHAKLDIKGNLAIEQMIKIAKENMDKMNSYTLKNAVKEVAGACVPMGIVCEGMTSKAFCKKIDSGDYDEFLDGEITTMTPERKAEIKKGFEVAVENVSEEFEDLKKKIAIKEQKEAQKAAKVEA